MKARTKMILFLDPCRGGSSLPVGCEYLYAFRVETKTALVLGGGGMYERGALSAMDDFIVSGRKSGEFDPPRRRRFEIARQKSSAPVQGVSR